MRRGKDSSKERQESSAVHRSKENGEMGSIIEQMNTFFEPKSVAVVGASRKIMKAGHVIFKNFADSKRRGIFRGELYPVNPQDKQILGFKCYSSVAEIPGKVELIVVVVPAEIVPKIMRDAALKGVKAAVIISGGFGEVGNHKLEEQVTEIANEAGIRLLGPNCLGVYNSATGVDMLFLPETKVLTTGEEVVATPRPMSGPIAIVTQSGAFGVSALDYLAGKELGVSKFVSFGNKCDVNEPEMLQYLLYDEKTRVILLYVESIEAGRDFMNVAKEVTKQKPIVALKLGRTQAGARAALSHTGAIAGSDRIYDTAFKQSGVVRVQDLEEFFDVGKALAFQPVEKFSDETGQKFEELKKKGEIPAFATNLNPLDLTGSVTSQMFKVGTKILLDDPQIYGLIVLGLHHVPALQEDFVDMVAEVSKGYTKPVVACAIGETEMALYIRARFDKLRIPAYFSPEDAARSMAALVKYGEYLKKRGCFEEYLERFHTITHS